MDSPYREPGPAPFFQATSREGKVTLELGPERVRLALGERLGLLVVRQAATWVRRRRGADRRRELALDPARLWLARSFPTGDLALWYESHPGLIERLGGVRPVPAFESGALGAWRALDRVSDELGRALAAHGGGALQAVELGRGQHRVLLVEFPDRLVLYARPLFRERTRRVLEVVRDGTLVIPGRLRDHSARLASRAGVTVSGDRIRFACPAEHRPAQDAGPKEPQSAHSAHGEGADGSDLVCLWLPWIALEDRQELARRFGELVDPSPPEPDYEARTWLRPWASGLGRPPASALSPAPLPRSIFARFRR